MSNDYSSSLSLWERVRVRAVPALAWLACLMTAAALHAQPPGGAAQGDQPAAGDEEAEADLEFVSAMERVLSRAIARAERSVVSIARRNKSAEYARGDIQPDLFRVSPRRLGTGEQVGPGFRADGGG